jgi:hypothetical protein
VPHTNDALAGQDGGDDHHHAPAWYRLRLPPRERAVSGATGCRFDAANPVPDE